MNEALLGNGSSECVRRFRSITPIFRTTKKEPSSEDNVARYPYQRSQSLPAKIAPPESSLSNTRVQPQKYMNGEDRYSKRDGCNLEKDSLTKSRRGRDVMRLNKKSQQRTFSNCNLDSDDQARKEKVDVTKTSSGKKNEYYLTGCNPGVKSSFSDAFHYFSEIQKLKDAKALPHLQPHNLTPFGTSGSLIFPLSQLKKKRQIVYPNVVAGAKSLCNFGFDLKATSNRDFSTDQTPSDKSTSSAHTAIDNKNDQKALTVSKDVEECNDLILQYKKLSPSYKPSQKTFRSGSIEEKQAVNEAVNFAAAFKSYYGSKDRVEDSNRNLQNGASEVHKKNLKSEVQVLSNPPKYNASQDGVPQAVKNKKYSFLSERVVTPSNTTPSPLRVRVGPKANLLQSSASPESVQCWDDVSLGKNERLVSPWPSYAEHVKPMLSKKRPIKITYPQTQGKTTKSNKNANNIQVQQLTNNQSKLESSGHSLQKHSNETTSDDPHQKRLFHFTQPNVKSLPDLRPFSQSKKPENEETVSPDEKPPFCDSCEKDFPPRTLATYDKKDCLCPEPKPPTSAPTLKRLQKAAFQEPPRACPDKEKCVRADDTLVGDVKPLSKIIAKECGPAASVTLKEGDPIPRLQKKHVSEPARLCAAPIKDCAPRADSELEVKKKSLPRLDVQKCPCPAPEIKMKECEPLKGLGKVKVEEVPKTCPKPQCAPRSDENLVSPERKLSRLELLDCPPVTPKALPSVPLPKLIRLYKDTSNDPLPQECPKTQCAPRSDEGLEVKPKQLPYIPPSRGCKPTISLPPSGKSYLPRLVKVDIKDPPRVCGTDSCPPRADDGFKIEPKRLPVLEINADGCKSSNECTLKAGAPLKRFKKVASKEAPRNVVACLKEPCSPRADDGLEQKDKKLPRLRSQNCPRSPKRPVRPATPLRRLEKVRIEEPAKTCVVQSCPPRADDGTRRKLKQLPRIDTPKCPRKEEEISLIDVPLKRLKKNTIKEPTRVCPHDDQCQDVTRVRSDQLCGYVRKPKNLPPMLLGAENNKLSVKKYLEKKYKENPPKAGILHKRKFSLYSKANEHDKILSSASLNVKKSECYSKKSSDYLKDAATPKLRQLSKSKSKQTDSSLNNGCLPSPRTLKADDKRKSKRGKSCRPAAASPKYAISSKVKRLPKYKKANIDWKTLKQCIAPIRLSADLSVKSFKQSSSRLMSTECPGKKQRATPVDVAPIRRLPKFKKPDINWAETIACKRKPCGPRADDNIREQDKKLPSIKFDKCPAINRVDIPDKQPRLKRLPKFKKSERDRCRPKTCGPRADDNLLTQDRSLPCIQTDKCPDRRDLDIPDKQPKMKRLPKFKKPDIVWTKTFECKPRPCGPRADDNLITQDRSLPCIKFNKCPAINRIDIPDKLPKMKRLPKFKKPDRVSCIPKTCGPRADDNLVTQNRSLHSIKFDDCPDMSCTYIPDKLPQMKRLRKFEKPDIVWAKTIDCKPKPCGPRADDNLVTQDRGLPSIKFDKCPAINRIDIPDKLPKMKRLPKFKKPDKAPCIPKTCGPRADDNLVTQARSLRCITFDDCPDMSCNYIPDKQPKMKRLPKFKKPDIVWVKTIDCKPKPCGPRADDNLITQDRSLPCIKFNKCPAINRIDIPDKLPKMKRLPKFKKPDRAPCIPKTCGPRADDNLVTQNRSLHSIKFDECPDLSNHDIPDKQPKIKRLQKFKKPDIVWAKTIDCKPKPCGPRADDNLITQDRSLPCIKFDKCPAINRIDIPDKLPKMKRLPKFKKPDKAPCIPKTCGPRADDNLVTQNRSLHCIKFDECPDLRNLDIPDKQPKMKRLQKFKKPDIVWAKTIDCKPKPCGPRADDNLITQDRSLPCIKFDKCPAINRIEIPEKQPKMKRLPKFKKPEKKCKMPEACVRADDNLVFPPKCLPRLNFGKGSLVKENIPVGECKVTNDSKSGFDSVDFKKARDTLSRLKMKKPKFPIVQAKRHFHSWRPRLTHLARWKPVRYYQRQKLNDNRRQVTGRTSSREGLSCSKSALQGWKQSKARSKVRKQRSFVGRKPPYPSFSESLQPRYPIISNKITEAPKVQGQSGWDKKKVMCKQKGAFRVVGTIKSSEAINDSIKSVKAINNLIKPVKAINSSCTQIKDSLKKEENKITPPQSCDIKTEKNWLQTIYDYFNPSSEGPKPSELDQKRLTEDAKRAVRSSVLSSSKPENNCETVKSVCEEIEPSFTFEKIRQTMLECAHQATNKVKAKTAKVDPNQSTISTRPKSSTQGGKNRNKSKLFKPIDNFGNNTEGGKNLYSDCTLLAQYGGRSDQKAANAPCERHVSEQNCRPPFPKADCNTSGADATRKAFYEHRSGGQGSGRRSLGTGKRGYGSYRRSKKVHLNHHQTGACESQNAAPSNQCYHQMLTRLQAVFQNVARSFQLADSETVSCVNKPDLDLLSAIDDGVISQPKRVGVSDARSTRLEQTQVDEAFRQLYRKICSASADEEARQK